MALPEPFTPRRDPAALERMRFDLLVIGGGITGATLAWDATLRGLAVALVDAGDFGAATSAATSKLIHGGLRYLKNFELGLVRESLRERRILQTIAGHLVRPLPFLIPTFKTGGNKRWMIKAGMVLYDALGFDREALADPEQRLSGHQMLSPAEVRIREPGIPARGLTGGSAYYDCRCEPERLTWEFVLGAASRGAVVVNHARVEGVACREGRVESAAVVDRLDGRRYEVHARAVANVAGPWADRVDNLFGTAQEVTLRRSKGIHLVTRPIVGAQAVVLRTAGGGHFFIIPWRGHSLIGTTDTEYTGEPDRLAVEDADVAAFLQEINRAYPAAKLGPQDVRYRYAGMRPLVDTETKVYQASRRYEIVDHAERGVAGLFSALGGKYTTSRALAQKLTDRILARLGKPAVPCPTAAALLPGSVAGAFGVYRDEQLRESGVDLGPGSREQLIWTYGARHREVLALVQRDAALGERVVEGRPEILAQVAFAVEAELARTLCDVLVRRTGIGTLGHPGQAALEKVARLAGKLLGWDADRIAREIAVYEEKVLGKTERLVS